MKRAHSLSLCVSGCVLGQMLSRLLNSSHPEDLKAANKLIKEMVQEVNHTHTHFYKLDFTAVHDANRSFVWALSEWSKIPAGAAPPAEMRL